MYKYKQVLFFLVFTQSVFSYNKFTSRLPNSISRDLYSYEEPQNNYDRNLDQPSWIYKNHEKTNFNYEPQNDYNDRIIFPDDYENFDKHKQGNSELERFVRKCRRLCPLKDDYNPVCGTDDVTYYNLDYLKCVRDCGGNVALKYLFACNGQGTTSSTLPPTTTTDNTRSCMSLCPTTSEYNPVCGTDNITYNNIGKLYCAQACGVEVQLQRHMPCPKKDPLEDRYFTSESPISTTTLDSRYFRSCLDSCITTSEYNPICASNGKTYYNKGKYQCAKDCGLDISVRSIGACHQLSEPDNIPSGTTSSPDVSSPAYIDKDLLEQIFSKEDPSDSLIDVRSA